MASIPPSSSTWLGCDDPRALRPELDTLVRDLQDSARRSCPGRTADLIAIRVCQLLGVDDPQWCATDPALVRDWYRAEDFSAAERQLLEVIEQFVIDVHSVTDEQFEQLRAHFTDREILALFYHAALADGFAKMSAALHRPSE